MRLLPLGLTDVSPFCCRILFWISIHFSDLEAAHFLFSVLPDDWLATCQVQSPSRIHEALEQVGHQTANYSLSLEDKVTNAMALIGSSSIAT